MDKWQDLVERLVCSDCIRNITLKAHIEEMGHSGVCSYCSSHRQVETLEEVRSIVSPRLKEVLVIDDDRYYAEMYMNGILRTTLVIQSNEPLVEDLCTLICTHPDNLWDEQRGGLGLRDDVPYEWQMPFSDEYQEGWKSFTDMVKHRRRFYLSDESEFLKKVFHKVRDLRSNTGITPFENLYAEKKPLYRARRVKSVKDVKDSLMNTGSFFSAPPHGYSKAGRMNPAGIPLLYCGNSQDTCITELRPTAGARVATAELNLLDDCIVLDLLSFGGIDRPTLDLYNDDFLDQHHLVEFLGFLSKEIAYPILKEDQDLDYLPTQVVAEYLMTQMDPPIDGLLYSSAQSMDSDRHYNVVLFNHNVVGTVTEIGTIEDNGNRIVINKANQVTDRASKTEWSKVYDKEEKSLSVSNQSVKIHLVKSMTPECEDILLDLTR